MIVAEMVGNFLFVKLEDGTLLRFTPSSIVQARTSFIAFERQIDRIPQKPTWMRTEGEM